jgi:hypothetical protein
MTSKEHKKHSDIARPSLGNFGRNEYAVLGSTCGNVHALADAVIKQLSQQYKCAFIDTEHKNADASAPKQNAFIEFTDKISYREACFQYEFDKFQYRQLFNETDLILVNGNHHEAAKQIVIIDKQKNLLYSSG